MNGVSKPVRHPNTNTRTYFLNLNPLLQKTNYWQKSLSYIAATICYNLPNSLKATEDLNTYKHKVIKHFNDRLKNRGKDIYRYFWMTSSLSIYY